jgi:tetratricopeptide (TPR) repeat protein
MGQNQVSQVASDLREGPITAIPNVIEKLVRDLRAQIKTEDHRMLASFARALHAAGYVASMKAKTSEVTLAINHYHELESVAGIINDSTLLNTALTYQGDMYRRLGDVQKAITYLEAAMKQVQKALDYIKLAEANLPQTPNNQVLLMIVRAEALIYNGEINSGEPLAIEAATISRIQGHYRRLERIQNMKRYLRQQASMFEKAEISLDEALNGPIEHQATTLTIIS